LGRTVSWRQAISYSLADWYVWMLLSVPILWLARRFPPERGPVARTAGVHLAGALVCSSLYVVLRAWVGQIHGWLIDEPATFLEVFRPLLVKTFPFNLLVYGVVVSVSQAIDYYRKYHERTVQTLELEKHLTEARLQSLLRQLKPHFLFNTLNGIASLMHSDVEAADTMLVRLSDLLRHTMTQTGKPLVSLREEITFLERYLGIESIRFRDRLQVTYEIAPGLERAQVPNLILQPIVENAIRHGIEPYPRPGRIDLSAARIGNRLVIEINDTGNGLPAVASERKGIGAANTRARLEELYGADHVFSMTNRAVGGLTVRLEIPYREES
jgi:two-component system, LytTR family, sensor kinase